MANRAPAIFVTLLLALAAVPGRAIERFAVTFADGSRLETAKLPAWPVPGKPFKVDERDLFAAENPATLVRDQEAVVELSGPFLKLANGDILPGLPQRLDPALGRQGSPLGLQVQLEPPVQPVDGSVIVVRTDRIHRIVGAGQAVEPEPPPGTVVLADGRTLLARSIRWRDYGLALLTADGIVEANYAELADVVFPGVDRLQAVLEDNLLASDEQASIMRFTLTSGGVLTSSQATRVEERARGRARPRVEVYYYVQPAWAAQSIAIAEEEIVWCGYRQADEAPLSLLPAETLANRRLIGPPVPWRRNAADREVLPAIGNRESDLAIASHSHSELAFTLPASAEHLSLTVGLSRQAGAGGCVQCKIFAGEVDGKLLWDSGMLTGEAGAKDTGPLPVAGVSRVVLVTEYAHDGRPVGADPFDIRDEVRWLSPLVTLRRDRLQSPEVLSGLLRGLDAWKLKGNGWAKASLESQWSAAQDNWEPAIRVPEQVELQLAQRIRITSANDILEFWSACPQHLDEHELTLTIDGEEVPSVASDDLIRLRKQLDKIKASQVRRRNRDDQRDPKPTDSFAYWWDLQRWRGKEVTINLTLRGERSTNNFVWRGLSLRTAIGDLPPDGKLPTVDVPLTTLQPIEALANKSAAIPLKDGLPGRKDEPLRFLGQTFTGGYGMVRSSQISFELDPSYKQFVAVVGCSAATAGPFQVLVDDQVVWTKPAIDNLTPAEAIRIDLPAGGKQLTLTTGADASYGGYAAWAEAGFLK